MNPRSNNLLMVRHCLIVALATLGAGVVVVAASAQGFDYPVGKPDGEGYGATGNDFLDLFLYACSENPTAHPGEDWNALEGEDLGDPVYAAAGGWVAEVTDSAKWGWVAMIEHIGRFTLPDGETATQVWSQYGHLLDIALNSRTGLPWAAGDFIFRGERLGSVGVWPADPRSPHLHFEIRKRYLPATFFPCGRGADDVTRGYVDPTDFVEANRRVATVGFGDDFDDNVIDSSRWFFGGLSVREEAGELHITTDVTDQDGWARTTPFIVDPRYPIVISRRAKLFAANNYYDGKLRLEITGHPELTFGVSYANYYYTGNGECVTVGFAVFRNNANSHKCADQAEDVSELIEPIWDRWFDERIEYNPGTGELVYSIDGTERIRYNVGALPQGAYEVQLHLGNWGWWTGHRNYSDNLTVQPLRSPFELTQ